MWGWLDGVKKFWNTVTGFFRGRREVEQDAETLIAANTVANEAAIELASTGALDPDAFRAQMREEIKDAYIDQYILGIGGRDQMTAADWGSVGGMIADQYRYLDGFIDEIRAGTLTEEQIRARAGMYINSSREAFERATQRNAQELKLTEMAWTLGEAEHCPDCLDLAAMGWVPMGTITQYPGGGQTQCLTNCQCHIAYRDPKSGKSY